MRCTIVQSANSPTNRQEICSVSCLRLLCAIEDFSIRVAMGFIVVMRLVVALNGQLDSKGSASMKRGSRTHKPKYIVSLHSVIQRSPLSYAAAILSSKSCNIRLL